MTAFFDDDYRSSTGIARPYEELCELEARRADDAVRCGGAALLVSPSDDASALSLRDRIVRRADAMRTRFSGRPLAAVCAMFDETSAEHDDTGAGALYLLKRDIRDDDIAWATFRDWMDDRDTPQTERVERTINARERLDRIASLRVAA